MTPLNPEWYDNAKLDFDRAYQEATERLFSEFSLLQYKYQMSSKQVFKIIERRIGVDLADEWMNWSSE